MASKALSPPSVSLLPVLARGTSAGVLLHVVRAACLLLGLHSLPFGLRAGGSSMTNFSSQSCLGKCSAQRRPFCWGYTAYPSGCSPGKQPLLQPVCLSRPLVARGEVPRVPRPKAPPSQHRCRRDAWRARRPGGTLYWLRLACVLQPKHAPMQTAPPLRPDSCMPCPRCHAHVALHAPMPSVSRLRG